MREISLHLLNLIENAIRAGASRVAVDLKIDTRHERLTLRVDDDGPGLSVPGRVAVDPFFTTKNGMHTGLGLSLLKAAAESAGGRLRLRRSPTGGLSVRAGMRLTHVDRPPLGDVNKTAAAVVCTHPEVDLRICFAVDGAAYAVSSGDLLLRAGGEEERNPIILSRAFEKQITEGMARMRFGE